MENFEIPIPLMKPFPKTRIFWTFQSKMSNSIPSYSRTTLNFRGNYRLLPYCNTRQQARILRQTAKELIGYKIVKIIIN